MITTIDKLLTAGLVLSATVIAICIIAATIYDPEVELFPGRTMPRSQAEKTLAVWDIAGRGREAKWINPDPKFSKYPDRHFQNR